MLSLETQLQSFFFNLSPNHSNMLNLLHPPAKEAKHLFKYEMSVLHLLFIRPASHLNHYAHAIIHEQMDVV